MRRGWLEAYLRRRYAWLLTFLLLTIAIDPALEQTGLTARGLETALAFALLAGAVGTGARGTRIAHGLAVLFLCMLASWLVLRVGSFAAAPVLAPALLGVSGLVMAGLVLVSVLRNGPVDGERICGALCVYLLAGIAFGGVFAALEALAPRSFSQAGDAGIGRAVYFSFMTLTSVGYGDIAPAVPAARALAILEAVFGQLYLAVLIARLVSLYERGSSTRAE
jgi:voltage-gated potassium channel